MAIVKVKLEAVRYLAARAIYGDDKTCKEIMNFVTYKRRSVGFTNLLINPYYRDGNSPRALNIIANAIASKAGDEWYKLVISDEGINHILGVLRDEAVNPVETDLQGSTLTNEYLITFFKQQEVLFVTKSN